MSLDVLLVEDNPGDVRLTQEAFRSLNEAVQLHVAGDGAQALAFLRQQGDHRHAPRPALILLDLNLPGVDGREVLACIKQDDSLNSIPTIVLSQSDSDADVEAIYQLQANCYVAKPPLSDDLDRIVGRINDFWLRYLKLPETAKN
jgi:CheY-like chemotaxis protein